MKITLTNEFHGTSVNLRVGYESDTNSAELTKSQIARAKRTLCGSDCQCSGDLGYRGAGNPEFCPRIDNHTGQIIGGTLLGVR